MGSEPSVQEESISINHPKFRKILYLHDYETVRSSIQVENEDLFNKWSKVLPTIQNS